MSLSLPKSIRAVFSDLDGTLTTDERGVLPSTLHAMESVREAGLKMILVTGRPAGWTDCLMRLWPLDAAIFENGAGAYVREETGVSLVPFAPPQDRARLMSLFEKCRAVIPHAHLSSDHAFRLFDFAIDHSEVPPHLDASEIEKILELLRSEPGVEARPSSTHINYLFGKTDKATGVDAFFARYAQTWSIDLGRSVFIGDSLNDEPLFELFENSVGVANIHTVWDALSSRPKQITESRGGKGFEELISHLLTQ